MSRLWEKVSSCRCVVWNVLVSVKNRNFEEGRFFAMAEPQSPECCYGLQVGQTKQNHPRAEGHLMKHPISHTATFLLLWSYIVFKAFCHERVQILNSYLQYLHLLYQLRNNCRIISHHIKVLSQSNDYTSYKHHTPVSLRWLHCKSPKSFVSLFLTVWNWGNNILKTYRIQ